MGQTHLPDFLATNPPLKTLRLGNNKLNDIDAVLIASALKRNTNLISLYLIRNVITDVGRKSLCNAIFDSSSLNAAADSNHTCCIRGIDAKIVDTNSYNGNIRANRARKIYIILSARNQDESNVQHLDLEFGDDSVKFAPKVLECVYRYSTGLTPLFGVKYALPLSITYEILRSWKMPELYERNWQLLSNNIKR